MLTRLILACCLNVENQHYKQLGKRMIGNIIRYSANLLNLFNFVSTQLLKYSVFLHHSIGEGVY